MFSEYCQYFDVDILNVVYYIKNIVYYWLFYVLFVVYGVKRRPRRAIR
jgi:hypothetical protein